MNRRGSLLRGGPFSFLGKHLLLNLCQVDYTGDGIMFSALLGSKHLVQHSALVRVSATLYYAHVLSGFQQMRENNCLFATELVQAQKQRV